MHMLSWEACQLWLDKLMGSLLSEAPQHFGAVNLTQILRADKDFFRYLLQNTKEISRVSPLKHDEAFRRLMHDPRINVHLIALPKGAKRPLETDKQQSDAEVFEKPDKKKLKVKKTPELPPSLKGTKIKNQQGEPLCWHFNLEKRCSNPVKSGRCRFGYHQCMRCLKTGHGAHECKSHDN